MCRRMAMMDYDTRSISMQPPVPPHLIPPLDEGGQGLRFGAEGGVALGAHPLPPYPFSRPAAPNGERPRVLPP